MIGIYKITSPKGRVYIGQSRELIKREIYYSKYIKKHSPQVRLFNSINKYTWELHKFEIIEECLFEELNNRERYWQDHYDVIGINGLNCILTKTENKPSFYGTETRKKMSISQKGKIRTNEHKKNISEAKKGIPIGIGKVLTVKHKLAISKGFKPIFSNSQIQEIYNMFSNKCSFRKIALKFNSNHSTISKYIKKFNPLEL